MKKNLTAQDRVIVVTILVCVFGIIGFPKSRADLVDESEEQHPAGAGSEGRQPPGAAGPGAGRRQGRGRPDHRAPEGRAARSRTSTYASIDRNDPATVEDADKIEINVKGVPATKTSAFRDLIAEHYPDLDPDARSTPPITG